MASKLDDDKIAGTLSQLALMEAACECAQAERAAIMRRIAKAADRDAAIDAARGRLAANMAVLLECRAARRKYVEQLKDVDVVAWCKRNAEPTKDKK